jgi:ABC-type transport system involved in multi-copper enzyme maturation permease subunit
MISIVVVRETIRRHVTNIGYLAYVAFLPILGLGVSRFGPPAAAWPTLVGLLAIITGCNVIGPEFSSGTLQLILVKPIDRSTYLLSRVAGVVSVVSIAAIVACLGETGGRMTRAVGEVPWQALGIGLLHAIVVIILTVSLLTFFGSFSRAYFNVALYVVLRIGLSMLPPILSMTRRDFTIVNRAVMFIDWNLYPDAPSRFDGPWLLLVLSNAAIALVLACLVFRNREVPYGAD